MAYIVFALGTEFAGAPLASGFLEPRLTPFIPRERPHSTITTFIPHLKGERAAVSWWGLIPNETGDGFVFVYLHSRWTVTLSQEKETWCRG